MVDAGFTDHAEAIVREAVSNAVRHSATTTSAVVVTVDEDLVHAVADNGGRIGAGVTGSGLTDLRRRAEESRRHVSGGGGPQRGALRYLACSVGVSNGAKSNACGTCTR